MRERKSMIRINQIKLPVEHKPEELKKKAARQLRIAPESIRELHIVKQSLDARKKEQLVYIYTVDVVADREKELVSRARNIHIAIKKEEDYRFSSSGSHKLLHPPVIVGTGPAGLFCGLLLAEAGYHPVLLERGEDVDARTQTVKRFWDTGILNVNSNVQFGAGGAGTFSDGKLNTLVKDPSGRNRKVLEVFVEHGANPEILYRNKPHIGTDVLSRVVKSMENRILECGGELRFSSKVTDIRIGEDSKQITGVILENGDILETETLVLAIGHSARDTFQTLLDRGIPMRQKAFAVGLRIQHPQTMITRSQYGMEQSDILGPASYKLTKQTSSGRGVYSFCMCPGGYVVNASSEEKGLAVNGMSYHDQMGKNANSALIVTVTPEDFGSEAPLAGVKYQQKLESLAYDYGRGSIPVQLYGDFVNKKESVDFGEVSPEFKGAFQFANLREMLPAYLSESLIEGMESFDHMISGFGRSDSILAGVESRTSSPVRIDRDSEFESTVKGVFPCGEGAGYAGGITSAAMDGIKVAEEIARRYQPFGIN